MSMQQIETPALLTAAEEREAIARAQAAKDRRIQAEREAADQRDLEILARARAEEAEFAASARARAEKAAVAARQAEAEASDAAVRESARQAFRSVEADIAAEGQRLVPTLEALRSFTHTVQELSRRYQQTQHASSGRTLHSLEIPEHIYAQVLRGVDAEIAEVIGVLAAATSDKRRARGAW